MTVEGEEVDALERDVDRIRNNIGELIRELNYRRHEAFDVITRVVAPQLRLQQADDRQRGNQAESEDRDGTREDDEAATSHARARLRRPARSMR